MITGDEMREACSLDFSLGLFSQALACEFSLDRMDNGPETKWTEMN